MGLLDVFKDGELIETIELSASKRIYRVGRQAGLADIVLAHASISREHATLTVSASGSVVVADLGSAQGTKISGKPLQPKKAHLLPPGRSLSFGQSSRVFKLREGSSGFVGEADADALTATASPDDVESIVCCGDIEADGAIGPWHFERVVSSRDGSVMMGADEVAPLREARARRAREKANAAQAKAEAEAERQRQREAKRQTADEDVQHGQAPVTKRPKHNPYLAHMEQDGEDDED